MTEFAVSGFSPERDAAPSNSDPVLFASGTGEYDGNTMDATWFSEVRPWVGGAAVCVAAVVMVSGLGLARNSWAAVFWAGACVVFAGLGTFAYQGVLALQDGYWTDWKFGAALSLIGLGNASSSPGGIMQSITALPVAAGLMGTGLLIAAIGTLGQAATGDRERNVPRKPTKRG